MVARAWLALLLLSFAGRYTLAQETNTEAAALASLQDAITNWDAATGTLPGTAWAAGGSPCSGGGTWKGVTCSAEGQVTQLSLSGLGLSGTLPEGLAQLTALTALDLSGNAFVGGVPPAWLLPAAFPSLASVNLGGNQLEGTLPADLLQLASQSISLAGNAFNGPLPAGWASPSLKALDLGNNKLDGSLPAEWGAALPALANLYVQGNNLTSGIPLPGWTSGGFAEAGATVEVRPANPALCGPIMPLDSAVFPAGTDPAAAHVSMANRMHHGNNLTTLMLTQRDLFRPGTTVTVTNWLASCSVPCSSLPGGAAANTPPNVAAQGLSWPPVIQTNIFDVGWVFNMSMSDLATMNAGVSNSRPGDPLEVPCYPDNANLLSDYFGGDAAFGQFAGGNQLAGPEGLPGAMAAARVVGALPSEHGNEVGPYYTGSLAPGGGKVVEPVYWFVDLLAPFQVSTVLVTAGEAMRNASLYIGNDASSVYANKLVASGINLEGGQQLAVAANSAKGRYVIVYTGALNEGTMSLRCVEIYTYESNAAPNMPVTASYLSEINRGGAGKILEALVDNNASTCVQLKPDSSYTPSANNTAWAFVDLGYFGTIGAAAVAVGPGMAPGTRSTVYVTQTADQSPSPSSACSGDGEELVAGKWAVGACNRTGRFITLSVTTPTPDDLVDLCELQVWLTQRPAESGSSSGGAAPPPPSDGGLPGGAVAGIVVGGVLVLAALLLLLAYLRWRRRWLLQQRQVAALTGKEQHWDDGQGSDDMEAGLPDSKQTSGGSGQYMAAGATAIVAPGAVIAAPAAAAAGSGAGSDGSGGAKAGGKAGGGARHRRYSEWRLMKEFIKAVRGTKDSSLSNKTRSEASYGPSIFAVAKGAAADVDADQAATDFTKLPPAFNEVMPADIQLIEQVGEGSFGEVWLAMYCGAFVAVKILAKVRSDNMTSSMQQQIAVRNLKKEALLMSKLRHPNVCLYLGACMDPACLLFEYCAKSSLDSLLRAGLENPQMAKRLNWVRLLSMALDAAKGMMYLHSRQPPIAHRDLKSANLLVDSQWRVKVADFSLSRAIEMGSQMAMMTVMTTNPRWLPPEVLGGLPGQLPADVWAFGTVLWELSTWRLPYDDMNTFQIIAMVQKQGSAGLVMPPPESLPAGPFFMYDAYLELMQSCLARQPEARPSFDVIVQQLGAILTEEVQQQQMAAGMATGNGSHHG